MKYTIKMTIFSEAEMDFHLQQLVKLCRVCGKRLCKAKGRASVFQCTKFKEGLLMTFGVDVTSDDVQFCPTKFCNPCHAVLRRAVKANKEGIPYSHTINPRTWTPHTDSCPVIIN